MKIKIIITTTNSSKTANSIAECLVKDRLSPCVQIAPNVKSVYIWNDKLEKTDELIVVIKTIPEMVEECKRLILKHHNYETPELIITNAKILNDEYKGWFIKNSQQI